VAVGGECVGDAGGISTRRTVTVGLESFKWTHAVPADLTHNAGSSYLILDTWAVTFDGAEVRLSHRDDDVPTLVLSAVGATIAHITTSSVYLDGPMRPERATLLAWRYTAPVPAFSVMRAFDGQ